MKRHCLDLLAALSVLLLIVLACGYFGTIGVFGHATRPGSKWHHEWELLADEGQIREKWATYTYIVPPTEPQPRPSDFNWTYPGPGRGWVPSLQQSLWGFDGRAFKFRTTAGMMGSCVYLKFPIWCVALPCLIAPALWLRKRRRKQTKLAGFEVVPA